MKTKIGKTCIVCSDVYFKQAEKFCSRKCYLTTIQGENNPNYGHRWTEEQIKKQSNLIKSKVDDVYRQKAGSANRGVKFSKERIEAMHGHRDSISYSRTPSEETKKLIGEKSKTKFTKEYKEKRRQQFVDLGYWIDDKNRSDFEIYLLFSKWIKPMWNLADPKLLKENGIFNSITNRNGLVRDHMLSRKFSFDEGIFPEIIRHPANCQTITHSENSSKRDKCSLTFKELCDRIETYKYMWEEQDLVLSLINRWRNGERFSANDYRRKSQCHQYF